MSSVTRVNLGRNVTRVTFGRSGSVTVQDRSTTTVVAAPGVGPRGPQGPAGPPGSDSEILLTSHEIDPTPHPAYDDMPSFTLLFENGLI